MPSRYAACSARDLRYLRCAAIGRCLDESQAPELLINAAAYTAVDRAEEEPEAAFRRNAEAPRLLAAACAERGIRLLHVSTDFVFDGRAARPIPRMRPAPLGVYGRASSPASRPWRTPARRI
jgi:dTDP-4-dehydrorhamnose reductase